MIFSIDLVLCETQHLYFKVFLTIYMHQFGWLSESGGIILNLLQKEGGTQKGGGFPTPEETMLPTMFGKPQMNIHYLETLTLQAPFRYMISFFGRINFQCMSSLVYTVYCQKQPSEQRCSVKIGVLKDFVNFIEKHLCWSLFF